MALEEMLTRLEINHSGELVAGFRKLGVVHFPNWNHQFVTKILGRKNDTREATKKSRAKFKAVLEKIKPKKNLGDYWIKVNKKYWWNLKIECPIRLKSELPEEFIRGHYTQQARWKLSSPGNYVLIEDSLVDVLKRKKYLEIYLDKIRETLEAERSKSYATRTFNDLNDLFDFYGGENFSEIQTKAKDISSLNNLDEILLERKKIADDILEINKISEKAKITYNKKTNKRERKLKVEQDNWDYINRSRMPSAQELLKRKWLFLDIEIPYFKRDDAKISWIGLTYLEDGVKKREIHTIHNLELEEVCGFKIFQYKDENELINNLTENINKEDPDFISSYNTKFDLIKLRESEAGFSIGDEETDPLFKVTTPFFERIGIKDRLIIDLLRWQKIARAFDINAKLEIASGFKKEINYNQMEMLEEKSLAGDSKSAYEIAKYLASDVENLTNLFLSKDFIEDLEDSCWLSKTFGIGLERILHSPNCINDIQEKNYFEVLGIYREEVPPHLRTKKMQSLKAKSKEKLRERFIEDFITPGEIKGLLTDVHKAYIPVGDFFQNIICRRFPEIDKFFEYKNQFKGNQKRLFFLEQYAKEFARWIREDYGFYLEEVNRFNGLIEGISREKFEDAYHDLRRNIAEKSEFDLLHLNNGDLSVKSIQNHKTPYLESFLKEFNLNYKDFSEIANQRSIIKRRGRNIIGNYDVFPSRDFFNPEKRRAPEDILVIDEILQDKFKEINDFIRNNGLQIIAREGNYLYLHGNRQTLEEKNCPLVFVEEIPKLYNADNPYYSKFGFFSHMKIKEEPDFHLNLFEMEVFEKMLENLLQGKNEEAIGFYRNALERLKSGNIAPHDLIFFNKSANQYFAYDIRTQKNKGKLYFIDNENLAEGEILTDEIGKYFKQDEMEIYIQFPNTIKPNFKIYEKRFVDKSRKILAPVVSQFSRKSKPKTDKNQLSFF